MPLDNLRVVVTGVPEFEGKFDVMQRDKREVQKRCEDLAKVTDQERAKFERALRDQFRSR